MVSGDNVVCPVIEPLAVWSIGLYGYIYNAPVARESGQQLGEWSRCASQFGQIQRQVV
jgi:hypothetical protein